MAFFSELWAEIQQSEWWAMLAELPLLASVAALLLIVVLMWLIGWQQKRMRTQSILTAVNDATFGRCIPRSRTGAWGFAVSVEPPPERFREFNISYQSLSIFALPDLLRALFGGGRTSLQISGVLLDAPTAEVIWVRGNPPARALGVNPGRAPWVQGRIDYTGVEYATRGTNVGAMKHVFHDMIARYTPLLASVTVQRERRPELQMVITGRIEPRDVSPLITSARALGRAAMLE